MPCWLLLVSPGEAVLIREMGIFIYRIQRVFIRCTSTCAVYRVGLYSSGFFHLSIKPWLQHEEFRFTCVQFGHLSGPRGGRQHSQILSNIPYNPSPIERYTGPVGTGSPAL